VELAAHQGLTHRSRLKCINLLRVAPQGCRVILLHVFLPINFVRKWIVGTWHTV
jgi:hypothetical protein